MAFNPKFKLGETVWCRGLTVRNSGTQHTNAYYLPVKCEIWRVQSEFHWNKSNTKMDVVKFKYGIQRPARCEKRTKVYRNTPITHHSYTYDNMCMESDLSRSRQVILRECRKINAGLKRYKHD